MPDSDELRVWRAEAERLLDERSEYAEQHGHPTFQDEPSAFIQGYIAGRASGRARA